MRWLLRQAGATATGAASIKSLMAAVDHTATSAAQLASSIGSDVSTEVLLPNLAAGGSIAPSESLDGRTDHELVFQSIKDAGPSLEDSYQPTSMWQSHHSLLLALVCVHLLAFCYWLYAYLNGRKLETVRSATARKALRNFQVVYEWSVMTTKEVTSSVRKKRPPAHHDFGAPQRVLVSSPGRSALRRTNSGLGLVSFVKGSAH